MFTKGGDELWIGSFGSCCWAVCSFGRGLATGHVLAMAAVAVRDRVVVVAAGDDNLAALCRGSTTVHRLCHLRLIAAVAILAAIS